MSRTNDKQKDKLPVVLPMDANVHIGNTAHPAEVAFSGEPVSNAKVWFRKTNFCGVSLGFAIAGFAFAVLALLGISVAIVFVGSMVLFSLAILFGVFSVINAYGKYWGPNKNLCHEFKNATKASFVMGMWGFGLSIGWPILLLVGLFLFMSIGLIIFS